MRRSGAVAAYKTKTAPCAFGTAIIRAITARTIWLSSVNLDSYRFSRFGRWRMTQFVAICPLNFEPHSFHRDRQFRARLAPIVGSGIQQGHLSPVIRQPGRSEAAVRRKWPFIKSHHSDGSREQQLCSYANCHRVDARLTETEVKHTRYRLGPNSRRVCCTLGKRTPRFFTAANRDLVSEICRRSAGTSIASDRSASAAARRSAADSPVSQA